MLLASLTVSHIAARTAQMSALAAGLLLGACAAPSRLPSMIPLTPDEQASSAAPARAGLSLDTAAAARQVNPEDPAAALAHAQALRSGNAGEKPAAPPSAATEPARKSTASLPQPSFQLGGPKPAE